MLGSDRSVIEAASWRLASELVRRHPAEIRLIRGHPGGGQSDLLWLLGIDEGSPLDVRLNRHGTIQVWGRVDGDGSGGWPATSWDEYLDADPLEFLERLERAAGLTAPASVPAATPVTLTHRVLAAFVGFAVKAVHPIEIVQGCIDTSGYGGGPNPMLARFPIDASVAEAREDDLFGEPGYRFWVVVRDREPIVAVEQTTARAWFLDGGPAVDLMDVYHRHHREPVIVAATLLDRARSG